MDRGTQHRSCCHEVPSTSLTKMESLLWIYVSRWCLISAFSCFMDFVLGPRGHCFFPFLHVAFRVDTGKPVRFSFNITPDSSWPSSRWHRTTTLKRAWYICYFFLTVLINEFVPVYWSKSICVCMCMCVASAGPGACVSAEWYSLSEDLDKPCWSGHNQWT